MQHNVCSMLGVTRTRSNVVHLAKLTPRPSFGPGAVVVVVSSITGFSVALDFTPSDATPQCGGESCHPSTAQGILRPSLVKYAIQPVPFFRGNEV